jgi:uncharacterized membrane protein YgcG
MAKKWEEVKAVCDDPAVPADKKQALLSAYVAETAYPYGPQMGGDPYYVENGKFSDEQQKYIKGYDAYPAYGKKTDDAYKDAKDAGTQAGYNEREHKKQVDEGKKKLAAQQPPSTGGAGTKTSDEIFDDAAPSLKMFEDFLPLLGKLPDDCKGNTKPLNFENDIKKRYDEQRGISFQKFIEDADRFTAGATSVESTMTDTKTQLSTLFGTWQGKAADAASKHYNDKIAKNAKTVHENLTGSSTAIHTAVTTVFRLCEGKAEAVNKAYTNVVGKADKAMAETVINIANDSHAGKDEMGRVAGWMDTNFGTNLREALNDDGCCDDDDIKKEGIRLAKQWIQMHFNPDLWDNLYLSFVKNCDDTKKLVDQAWDSLDKIMADIQNDFEGVKESQPPADTHPSHDTGGGGGSGKGGGSGNGGGSGSGGSTGGGGTTTPEASMPTTPKPGADAAGADGTNPVTGKPLEVDPQTGQPYPIDPKTGEAIKDAGDEQEKVTVEKGDNKITMTEPDKDGKMAVSVDDGKGHLKDYKLDFDDKAAGATADGKSGDFGPQGVKDGAPGADGVYKPGPDGKIHIQDGDLKITAEQPKGPDGPTVVTVDDGKGEPTKYTLDENNTAKDGLKTGDLKAADGKPTVTPAIAQDPAGSSAAGGTGGAGADSGASNLDGVHTMPAEAGFSAPGGLDLGGDLAPAAEVNGAAGAPGDPVAGDAGASAGGGQTEPASSGGELFSDGGSASSAGATGSLGDAASLQDGAQTSSDASYASSDTGLGAAPGGMDPNAHQQPAAAGASAGGMGSMGGMMGGMGGGGGGGGGGDQQRGSSQYKVEGAIFETSGAGGRISGSLDDEGDRSIRYDR